MPQSRSFMGRQNGKDHKKKDYGKRTRYNFATTKTVPITKSHEKANIPKTASAFVTPIRDAFLQKTS